jgi:hypothetical protein
MSSTVSAPSLAASLKPFLRLRKAELTLGEMLERVESDDGPGPVLFILTLPVLLPLPPGFSMVLALPSTAWGVAASGGDPCRCGVGSRMPDTA